MATRRRRVSLCFENLSGLPSLYLGRKGRHIVQGIGVDIGIAYPPACVRSAACCRCNGRAVRRAFSTGPVAGVLFSRESLALQFPCDIGRRGNISLVVREPNTWAEKCRKAVWHL